MNGTYLFERPHLFQYLPAQGRRDYAEGLGRALVDSGWSTGLPGPTLPSAPADAVRLDVPAEDETSRARNATGIIFRWLLNKEKYSPR